VGEGNDVHVRKIEKELARMREREGERVRVRERTGSRERGGERKRQMERYVSVVCHKSRYRKIAMLVLCATNPGVVERTTTILQVMKSFVY
jgi:hypothetical protein